MAIVAGDAATKVTDLALTVVLLSLLRTYETKIEHTVVQPKGEELNPSGRLFGDDAYKPFLRSNSLPSVYAQ